MKGSKTINAGELIEDILNIAQQNNIIEFEPDDLEEDLNTILFSLGFPHSKVNLKVEW